MSDKLPFHPIVARWFDGAFDEPTDVQMRGWQSIAAGRDTLISAPTGSGKTLAAFMSAVSDLFTRASQGTLGDHIHVVYVSPLKALGNDIEKNLRVPLEGIAELAEAEGLDSDTIRIAVRSGDTPAYQRQLQVKNPPHILITTPESLYILLTAERSRNILSKTETIILDEIHAIAADKRGSHLALTVERLNRLAGGNLQRVGLSATQKPIEEVARLLVGSERIDEDGQPRCTIVDAGHKRQIDLAIELADFELGPIPSHEMRDAIYDRLVELAGEHRTTIVFTNTRRMVERVSHALAERMGKDKVRAHHGSLSRETRLGAEQGLKSGEVPVVVATASLELGIDVGHVDLVCHLGAPRSIAQLLQRVGRSGHFLGAVPKGILFPFTRDELVQCAAAVRAIESGELDRLLIPVCALDILAQQIVACIAAEEMAVDEVWDLVRKAWPYRNLDREIFDQVIDMLSEGVSNRRGRKTAHLHHDRVGERLRPRRGARLAAITSGGAIPDMADYDVVEDTTSTFVGTVNEDFAIDSMAGDIFQLGNRSWRIQRVENGRVRVTDADGAPPTMPFWFGEAPGRTAELSDAVADLRVEIARRASGPDAIASRAATVNWLVDQTHVCHDGAEQLITYIREAVASLGELPTRDTIIAERFFDEAGGMQLVLHTPFGARLNRAYGLAMRKRFCVNFDFELQAAATDDGIVLSLGEQHSFPLDNAFALVSSRRVEADLIQASLQSPMFTNRWRWNATRSLAMLRHSGGKRVPIAIQRMRAEDLVAAVFPAQLGCQDNRSGPIQPPDHPLVNETLDNCLHEAMDSDGLKALLERIENGELKTISVETPAPSPLSHEILNANPYAFLDDAPLEERRARAVSLRRFEPQLAGGIGALDQSAIAVVRDQAWPEARNADEVHDALLTLCMLPARPVEEYVKGDGDGAGSIDPQRWHSWQRWLGELVDQRRVVRVRRGERVDYVASERAAIVRTALAGCDGNEPRFEVEPPEVRSLTEQLSGDNDAESAIAEIVRGWSECSGPITAAGLGRTLGVPASRISVALARLEADGTVLQGSFSLPARGDEWCERGLLARIHRLTLGRLRREIEPVSRADFMRFLLRWQHAWPETRLHGRDGLRAVIAQLGGIDLPGPAWERDVLPARIERYDPADLEQLCLAGEVAWGRLGIGSKPDTTGQPADECAAGDAPRKRRPVTRSAPLSFFLREDLSLLLEQAGLSHAPGTGDDAATGNLSTAAQEVLAALARDGASFLVDIARTTGRLPGETEDALWELVAAGLATGDGVAGLRTLLLPDDKRRAGRKARRAGHLRALPGRRQRRLMPVGRWSLLRGVAVAGDTHDRDNADSAARSAHPGARLDAQSIADTAEIARDTAVRLLERYGVVFRDLLARERLPVRWRVLLYELRRLEASGEIRGGRFVDGVIGEQFALPAAVESLRRVRKSDDGGRVVIISAADPLNLVGILTAGERISPLSRQVIAYRDGVPIDTGELGAVRSRLQRA